MPTLSPPDLRSLSPPTSPDLLALFASLIRQALPALPAPAWKVVSIVAVGQLRHWHGISAYPAMPVALSLSAFMRLTGMARVTVISAIRAAMESGWLTQTKRRTRRGRHEVAYYQINWANRPVADPAPAATSAQAVD